MTIESKEKVKKPDRPDLFDRISSFLTGASVPSVFVNPLTRLALSWLSEGGPDVYATRFKSYKKIYISMITTGDILDVEFKDYYSTSRSGKSQLRVRPIREFFKWSKQSDDRISQVRAWLDLVYMITPNCVTDDVFQDWKSYVDTPHRALTPRAESILKSVLQDFKTLYGGLDYLEFTSQTQKFVKLEESPRRSPYYNEANNRMVSSPRSNLICYHWVPLWTTSGELYQFYQKFPSQVNQCLLGTDTTCIPKKRPSFYKETPIGSIACILEQGVKYRWIANPHISVQMVGQPIKECFSSISVRIPWVYTFNQDDGRNTIKSLQRPGRNIHCFDASKFTDTFSRYFQKMVCTELARTRTDGEFMSEYIDLVSASPWQYKSQRGIPTTISWKSGQPLGTGPSFHIACVSHAMVLYASSILSQMSQREVDLYLQTNEDKRPYLFADYHLTAYEQCQTLTGCVGDDSFIADDKIAEGYDYLMTLLGVQINKSKSIVSDKLAEFCGKWIKDGNVVTSSKPVAQYSHYSQLVDEVRKYGEHMLKSIPFSEVALFNVLPVLSRPKSIGGTGLLSFADVLKAKDDDVHGELTQRAFELFCSGLIVNDVSMGVDKLLFDLHNHTVPRRLRPVIESRSDRLYSGLSEYYDLNNRWFDCSLFADGTEIPDLINAFSGLPVCTGKFERAKIKVKPAVPRKPSKWKPGKSSRKRYEGLTFYGLIDNINRLHRDRDDWVENYVDRYRHEISCTISILLGGPSLRYIPYHNPYDNNEALSNIKESIYDQRKERTRDKTDIYTPFRTQARFKTSPAGFRWFANYRTQGQP